MNLKEFRKLTEDLPENTVIYIKTEENGNPCLKSPQSLKVRTEDLRFLEGMPEIYESSQNYTEIILDF